MTAPHANVTKPLDRTTCWPVDIDLPSLSCHAAAELDNIILGRATDLAATRQLTKLLSEDVSPGSLLPTPSSLLPDPVTAVIMTQAIDDALLSVSPLSTLHEVAAEAKKIQHRLQSVVDAPQMQDEKDLREMRSFCLALSKRASTRQQQGFETWEPPHLSGK